MQNYKQKDWHRIYEQLHCCSKSSLHPLTKFGPPNGYADSSTNIASNLFMHISLIRLACEKEHVINCKVTCPNFWTADKDRLRPVRDIMPYSYGLHAISRFPLKKGDPHRSDEHRAGCLLNTPFQAACWIHSAALIKTVNKSRT